MSIALGAMLLAATAAFGQWNQSGRSGSWLGPEVSTATRNCIVPAGKTITVYITPGQEQFRDVGRFCAEFITSRMDYEWLESIKAAGHASMPFGTQRRCC